MKDFPELDPLAERPNMDFSKGVRGKHYDRMQQDSNLIHLERCSDSEVNPPTITSAPPR
jgi:hypothetical protein